MITLHRTQLRLKHRGQNRRGATAVLALFLMTALVGMLAFGVDIGYLSVARGELKRTADAAALAGCWQMYDSAVAGQNVQQSTNAVVASSQATAQLNTICNGNPALDSQTDISLGYLASLGSAAALTQDPSLPYRGVQIRVRKTDAMNGRIPYSFARIFGLNGQQSEAIAVAAMGTQVKGFQLPAGSSATLDLLPFALDQQTWQAMLAGNATDAYSYNAATGQVTSGADGALEVNLYPQGTGSPGNRGTVDIGGSNNSTADIARQIVYGISSDDLQELGKELTLNSNGQMTLNGDTGISAGVKDELASIIGQTRIIPIFSSVSGNGNNAQYTIVSWQGVRILDVKLTGSMQSKKLIVQPAPIVARGAVVGDSSRTWSSSVFTPAFLIR